MKTTYRVRREESLLGDIKSVNLYREEREGTTIERVIEIKPAASLRVVKHSPAGFEFGYSGSGPAQLALAILLDVAQGVAPSPELAAEQFHQDFKTKFIAIQESDEFELDGDLVKRWLCEKCGAAA